MLLALDTTGSILTLVLADVDGTLIGETSSKTTRGHAEAVFPLMDTLLADAGISFGDLSRVAAVTGPGAFTSIRIGLAVARGLALPLEARPMGIDRLSLVALSYAMAQGPKKETIVALTAGRGVHVFARPFTLGVAENGRVSITPEDEARSLPFNTLGDFFQGKLVGEEDALWPEGLQLDASLGAIGAKSLIKATDLLAGTDLLTPCAPFYVRPPDAIKAPGLFHVAG